MAAKAISICRFLGKKRFHDRHKLLKTLVFVLVEFLVASIGRGTSAALCTRLLQPSFSQWSARMDSRMRIPALLLLVCTPGCASMRSTMLNRTEADTFVKNGLPTKGVPVTVRVPSHLDVWVVETMYYDASERKLNEDDKEHPFVEFKAIEFPVDVNRNLKLRTKLIRTEKVMTVDFVRPAAGIGEYNVKFDQAGQDDKSRQQYITQFESMIYDRTMEDTANLVASLVPNVAAQPRTPDPTAVTPFWLEQKFALSSAGGDVVSSNNPDTEASDVTYDKDVFGNLIVKDRVVAYGRFDIDACDYEEQVRAFVDLHLNACHDCCGKLVPEQ